jgi:hypothetical protein
MDKLFALLQFMLALFGVDAGGRTLVDHVVVDGRDLLYSRVHVAAGVARFDCVRSGSGRCHYTVLPPGCIDAMPAAMPDCLRHPLRRFAVARGHSEQVAGLTRFQLCVSASAAHPGGDCDARRPLARR